MHPLPSRVSLPRTLLFLAAATLLGPSSPALAEDPFADLPKRVGSGLEQTTYDHELEVAAPATAGDTPIADALAEAMPMLGRGESVRLKLGPGVFREILGHVVFEGDAVDASLAFVGAGSDRTIWRGSDAVSVEAWKDLGGGLYALDWPHDWGNWAFPWETPEVIGHRSEMVFAGGSPLRQVMLEEYDYDATGELMDHGSRKQTWTYTGFREPAEALEPGTFGVAERDENGNRLFVRLADGQSLDDVEVSTRRQAFRFDDGEDFEKSGKNHLRLEGIAIEHFASRTRGYGEEATLALGKASEGLHVEDCRFAWNNGTGFGVTADRVTLRNNEVLYNGFGGIGGQLDHALLENNVTSYNNWRGAMGGQTGWWMAGVKLHESVDNLVRGHEAIGNNAGGFWYDIHNKNLHMQDLVLIDNDGRGLFMELSNGPFLVERLLSAGNEGAVFLSIAGDATVRDSVLQNASTARMEVKKDSFQVPVVGWQWYLRTDEHATRAPLIPAALNLEDCVLLAANPDASMIAEHNGITRTDSAYPPSATLYHGRNNLMFAGGETPSFAWVTGAWELKQANGLDAWAAWTDETGSRLGDPMFADAAGYDFTLRDGSPLADRVEELPLQKIDPAKVEEAARVRAWFRGERSVLKPAY